MVLSAHFISINTNTNGGHVPDKSRQRTHRSKAWRRRRPPGSRRLVLSMPRPLRRPGRLRSHPALSPGSLGAASPSSGRPPAHQPCSSLQAVKVRREKTTLRVVRQIPRFRTKTIQSPDKTKQKNTISPDTLKL